MAHRARQSYESKAREIQRSRKTEICVGSIGRCVRCCVRRCLRRGCSRPSRPRARRVISLRKRGSGRVDDEPCQSFCDFCIDHCTNPSPINTVQSVRYTRKQLHLKVGLHTVQIIYPGLKLVEIDICIQSAVKAASV